MRGRARFDWRTHSWLERTKRSSLAAVSHLPRFDGSFAIVDEIRHELQYRDPKALNHFSGAEVWHGRPGEIEGLIRDWVSWQQSSDQEAFNMLERVLKHLSPSDIGPLVPVNPPGYRASLA